MASASPTLKARSLQSSEAVKAEAILAAREIMADRMIKGDEPDHSRFEVKDDKGRTVLVFPFSEALPKTGRSDCPALAASAHQAIMRQPCHTLVFRQRPASIAGSALALIYPVHERLSGRGIGLDR